MMSERISTRVAARAAGFWLLGALLLAAQATVAAPGDGTDHECGVAESCAGISPSPQSTSSSGARGTARDRDPSVRAGNRRASRKVRSSKVAPSSPTLVATDASTARGVNKRAESR